MKLASHRNASVLEKSKSVIQKNKNSKNVKYIIDEIKEQKSVIHENNIKEKLLDNSNLIKDNNSGESSLYIPKTYRKVEQKSFIDNSINNSNSKIMPINTINKQNKDSKHNRNLSYDKGLPAISNFISGQNLKKIYEMKVLISNAQNKADKLSQLVTNNNSNNSSFINSNNQNANDKPKIPTHTQYHSKNQKSLDSNSTNNNQNLLNNNIHNLPNNSNNTNCNNNFKSNEANMRKFIVNKVNKPKNPSGYKGIHIRSSSTNYQ